MKAKLISSLQIALVTIIKNKMKFTEDPIIVVKTIKCPSGKDAPQEFTASEYFITEI